MKDIINEYIKTTPTSNALAKSARSSMPGGDTRTTAFWEPYPLYFKGGSGSSIKDVDGTDRIDFAANFTSMILGHSHPSVINSIENQIHIGFGFYGASESQTKLAAILCNRLPSVDQIRFTNSGTEATMNCIKAARAFTGKQLIAKFEGGYHGTHDTVSISTKPKLTELSEANERPRVLPDNAGITLNTLRDVVVLPYNDLQLTESILLEHSKELAAIIVEPILGTSGMIPADFEFLKLLRNICDETNCILIFDEVVSFRLSSGGAQEMYSVKPDLTALGKLIGGGLPVGAFGGREDIMSLFNPMKTKNQPNLISQSGSFNANPVVMEAGIATMKELTPSMYIYLNDLGNTLREYLKKSIMSLELPIQITGAGSLFGIHFTDNSVTSYRDAASVDTNLTYKVFLELINHGILLSSRLLGSITAPMTIDDVNKLNTEFNSIIKTL
ncbi:MAG: aspartate aminotransferase family protein [Chloroflexi bacterium]|nr:aspartate aminotransferase family protein [Chloroflexota bacterium]|tara:strand:- start:7713 stop:9044 length:1332 start_codon:yes stop_codon:yes gene_type:complete